MCRHLTVCFAFLFLLVCISCKKSEFTDNSVEPSSKSVSKPTGVFSASGAMNSTVLNHSEVRGVLVRALWKDIERNEGSFDFTLLDNQISAIKAVGKKYSLSVLAGGIGSPDWLISQKNVPYFNYLFRGTPEKLPLIWDDKVLEHLDKLAVQLAAKYKSDSSLLLVYIPQMTANGVEGHLNGFVEADFVAAGYTENRWIDASVKNAKNFAKAFENKALAFEVHNLFNSEIPASTIINSLWSDVDLNHRVGAAMWWISGNYTYQSNLITVLENFEGDIYCQVIKSSDSAASFPDGDYTKVFEQAKKIKARYIEPWDHEFTLSAWDSVFSDFNAYADALK